MVTKMELFKVFRIRLIHYNCYILRTILYLLSSYPKVSTVEIETVFTVKNVESSKWGRDLAGVSASCRHVCSSFLPRTLPMFTLYNGLAWCSGYANGTLLGHFLGESTYVRLGRSFHFLSSCLELPGSNTFHVRTHSIMDRRGARAAKWLLAHSTRVLPENTVSKCHCCYKF